MSNDPVFICYCPHCRRRNQASIRLLAKKKRCDHCKREFRAEDNSSKSAATFDPIYYWIRFTENETTLRVRESGLDAEASDWGSCGMFPSRSIPQQKPK